MFETHNVSIDRTRRIAGVIADCIRRRKAGEPVLSANVVAAHPDLMPELANELRLLPLFEAVRKTPELSALSSSELELYLDDEQQPHAIPVLPPGAFPGYEVIREISQGGQAIVYEAIHLVMERKVAIKVPLDGAHASAETRRRFEREIKLIAELKHPNIISIFDSDTTLDGRPYYVMDYVHGQPLNRYVRDKSLTLEETLRLFATVCDAVYCVHQRAIIHRDLKPSNILVDANGVPQVLDFGLAKRISGPIETALSQSQNLMGTLPYMSPEQARGNSDAVDVRTDVYALGVILYELLTGHRPYPITPEVAESIRHITETPPTPPQSKWTRDSGVLHRSARRTRGKLCPIDGDVETIALKALAKDPDRRYQSADELRQDICRYLDGEPIEAKRDSLWYVLSTRVARNRGRLVAGIIVGVLVLALSGIAIHQTLRAVALRSHALLAEYNRRLSSAELYIAQGDFERAEKVLATIPKNSPMCLEAGMLGARLHELTGAPEQADAVLIELARRYPQNPMIQETLREQTQDGQTDQPDTGARQPTPDERYTARDLYRRALAEPNDTTALALLNNAVQLDPTFPGARNSRSLRYFRLQRFEEALADARIFYDADRNSGPAIFNYGTILTRLSRCSEAIPLLKEATKLMPEMASAWYNLGLALELSQRFADAVPPYEHATRLEPANTQKWLALGRARAYAGDVNGARLAAENIVALDPGHFDATFLLAGYCADAGEFDEAQSLYRTCLALPRGNRVVVWLALADTQLRSGDELASLASCEAALQCDPESTEAAVRLAWSLLTAGKSTPADLNRALALSVYLAQQRPDQISVNRALALAMLKTDRLPAAYQCALYTLDAAPDDPWLLAVASAAAHQLGDVAQAQALRLRALEVLRQQPTPDIKLEEFLSEMQDIAPRTQPGSPE